MSAHAIENARAWFQNIKEMVARYDASGEGDYCGDEPIHAAEQDIPESPLSVLVRSGWYVPGQRDSTEAKPAEYEILLSTGGPALRIVGDLSEHGEPETATLQWQDWGTPWTNCEWWEMAADGRTTNVRDVLLSYASHFYFGEI